MKKSTVKLLICVLALVVLSALLVACNTATENEDLKNIDYIVTFKYNITSEMAGGAELSDQYLGVSEGGLVSIRPGYDGDKFPERSVVGYYVENWYEAELDEEGKEIMEDGLVKLKETPWDFARGRVNADLTLYAKMLKSPVLHFIEVVDGKEHEVSQIIGARPGATRGKPDATSAPRKENCTFLGKYYKDATFTEEFEWKHTEVNASGVEQTLDRYMFTDQDVNVYVQFLDGVWSLVSNASQFASAVSGGQNVYLMNDIAFTESYNSSTGGYNNNWTPSYYNGVINGNGHTVSNIHVVKSVSRNSRTNFAIFGQIDARAEIYDINFVNCTVDVLYESNVVGSINVALFAWSIAEGAILRDVNVSGALTVNYNYYIANKLDVTDFIGGLTDNSKYIHSGCSWDISVNEIAIGDKTN